MVASLMVAVFGWTALAGPEKVIRVSAGERSLMDLILSLPRHLKNAEFPPLDFHVQHPTSPHRCFLMKAERVGKKQARIILGVGGTDSCAPNAVITFSLKLFNGKWHVSGHEESAYYKQGDQRDSLLKLIALIDSSDR